MSSLPGGWHRPFFNRRAVDCARDETYLPALDPEGRPIPGECEFSIEFLN
jgi:hypothetical protein